MEGAGDTFWCNDAYADDRLRTTVADFIVSFGYRKILKGPVLSSYKDRIINIHISFLPWNRGADPNFWSWFDDTPKGVSIHRIDAGIDTGNIIVQDRVKSWPESTTLKSSHDRLMKMAVKLFADNWVNIRRDGLPTRKCEPEYGSYHKIADKEPWFSQSPLGWDTPVKEVRKLGKKFREQHETKNRSPRPRQHRQQAFKEF